MSHFEREKACYEQNSESARGINRQMNQLPVLVITLTGGLWYGAAVAERVGDVASFGALVFAAICNLCLVLAALRVRDVLRSYLEKAEEFHPTGFANGVPKKPMLRCVGENTMIRIYSALMLSAAVLSLTGALTEYWPSSWGAWPNLCWGVVLLLSLVALGAIVWLLCPRKDSRRVAR